MAVSTYHSFRMLDRWQERMGESIWSFNQINDHNPRNAPAIYIQTERDILADALRDAFVTVSQYIGYNPMPVYGEAIIHLHDGRDWRAQLLALDTAKLQAFGVRAATLIEAGVNVIYSDEDGDGYADTATLTATGATGIDPSEIRAFFRVSDGAVAAADERYEVTTYTVTVVGDTVTLRTHRALCVQPLYHALPPTVLGDRRALDIAISDYFVEALDIYRIYTDATSAATLFCEPDHSATQRSELNVSAVLFNEESSEFALRLPSGTAAPQSTPYAVRVRYLSGLPLINGHMMSPLEAAIIRIANVNALLSNGLFAYAVRELWDQDNMPLWDSAYIPHEYVNPLGIKRGHLEAWKTLVRYADRVKGRVTEV